MTDDELAAVLDAHARGGVPNTHWDTCHLDGNPRQHSGCAVARLVAEVRRLRAEVARAVADYEACEGENDRYLAEVRRAGDAAAALRAALAARDALVAALGERLAAASQALSRAAERRPDLFPEAPT